MPLVASKVATRLAVFVPAALRKAKEHGNCLAWVDAAVDGPGLRGQGCTRGHNEAAVGFNNRQHGGIRIKQHDIANGAGQTQQDRLIAING